MGRVTYFFLCTYLKSNYILISSFRWNREKECNYKLKPELERSILVRFVSDPDSASGHLYLLVVDTWREISGLIRLVI